MLFTHATPDPKSKVKQVWDSDAIDTSDPAATYLLDPYLLEQNSSENNQYFVEGYDLPR